MAGSETLLMVGLLLSLCGFSSGVTITPPSQSVVEKAQGDTVTLECKFTLDNGDNGPLDIEWSLQPPDNQDESKLIITYSGDRVYDDYYAPMKGRVHFVAADPKTGDASVTILQLLYEDTGTYQCKVKKAPGLDLVKMKLTVLVKPTKPKCIISGPTEVGRDISLKCHSSEGTAPMTYTWEKTTDTRILPASSSMDTTSGTLTVRNATNQFSGTYRCVAQNKVGTDDCIVNFSVTQPTNKAGAIAGAIIGVILSLLLIAIIVWCCCRRRKEKKYERELPHEIREDVPAPKSRTSTAHSFISSNRSSLGSMSPSNMNAYPKTQYNKVNNEEYGPSPNYSVSPEPSKVAGHNLNRMGAVPVMIPAQSKDGSIV